MKQLIIQSLSLSNSLYKKSFIKIIIFTSLGLFFIFIFYNFNKIKEKENNNKRTAIQKIIVNSIVSSSKYGDIIYSRANSLQLGKSLGLIDLGICDKGRDIFERINETRCRAEEQVSDEVIVTKENTYLNNQSYTLEFE